MVTKKQKNGRKKALITGGSGSIGRSLCRELAKDGIDLLINYKEKSERAQSLCNQLSKEKIEAFTFKADITSPKQVKDLFRFIEEKWGYLDILINNAGIVKDNVVTEMSLQDWNEVLTTNLTGVFYCCREAIPWMRSRGFGRIINMSSVVSLTGNFGQVNYCAAKAGIIGLTKTLAIETSQHNITVNAICPGFIDTRMVNSIDEKIRTKILQKIPKRRLGKPEEVARLVSFLAQEPGDYITGQVFVIDGGWTLA